MSVWYGREKQHQDVCRISTRNKLYGMQTNMKASMTFSGFRFVAEAHKPMRCAYYSIISE